MDNRAEKTMSKPDDVDRFGSSDCYLDKSLQQHRIDQRVRCELQRVMDNLAFAGLMFFCLVLAIVIGTVGQSQINVFSGNSSEVETTVNVSR